MYTTNEIKAVVGTVDAIINGLFTISESVELDENDEGALLPDDEVAMARLQQLLDAVTAIYPDARKWYDNALEVMS